MNKMGNYEDLLGSLTQKQEKTKERTSFSVPFDDGSSLPPLDTTVQRYRMEMDAFHGPDDESVTSEPVKGRIRRCPDVCPVGFFQESEEQAQETPLEERLRRKPLGLLELIPKGAPPFPSVADRHIPNIQKSLGSRKSNTDRRKVCKYLLAKHEFQVRNQILYVFEPPCWRRLEGAQADVFVNRQLSAAGIEDYTGTADIREIVKLLLLEDTIQHTGEFTPPEGCINFCDGTLNLNTGSFYRHRSSDEFTHFINCTYAAVRDAEPGSYFDDFIQSIDNGNPEIRQQILELIVIALAGIRLKYFFVLLGPSHTGKTQLGRFLEELLGMDQVESVRDIEDFKGRFTTGEIAGKRLVTCLDLPDAPIPKLAVGKIKELVGDDSIKGENKYQRSFTYNLKPLLLFAGNYPITFSDLEQDTAFLNRMVVIPFSHPCAENKMVQHLYRRFLEEMPYIIQEAIAAFDVLQERNFQVTKVDIPQEYQPRNGLGRDRKIVEFLREMCIQEECAEVGTQQLLEAYRVQYPEEAELGLLPFSRKLSKAFSAAHIPVVPVKRVNGRDERGFRGVRLREDDGGFPERLKL